MTNATTKKPKFHIKTWGCQMNYSDTSKMVDILEKLGMRRVKEVEEADVIILNTCSVRQRAEDKVSGLGRQFLRIKEDHPDVIIIMTGCMGQRVCRKDKYDAYDIKYQQQLKRRLEWIDYFVHIGDLERLADIMIRRFDINEELMKKRIKDIDYINYSQKDDSKVTSFVPISKGCNNFCTYCIVPFTRGKEVSREMDSILSEIKCLIQNGCKLITLLGQNVNSWRDRVDGSEIGFPKLLEEICKLDGDFWLTFLTSHPKDFSKELVDTMSKCEKICKYLNLPIQSGSNDILKKMNRNYTWMDYTNKIDYLLEKIPDIRLSTDIIVGFPGETEKDFLDTYSLVKKIDYSMAYVSEYSPRPGAVSEKMVDNVPKSVKKRRKKKITDLVTDYVKYQNESEIGEEKEILVISEKRGQTFDLRDVILKGKGWHRGEFTKGKIIEGNEKGLVAEVVS